MLNKLLKELEIRMWEAQTTVIMKDRLEKYSSGTPLILHPKEVKMERGIQNLHLMRLTLVWKTEKAQILRLLTVWTSHNKTTKLATPPW